ncbi:MAG: hypothetical protein ACFFCX_10030 [Candidatus Sifarchaeia archaeon]
MDISLSSNRYLYPSISLNLTETSPISFEILETGNTIVGVAYALNPSHYEIFVDSESVLVETWNGGNVEYTANGLAHGIHYVKLKVYHISQQYLGNTTAADVEDLTPLSVIFGRSNIVLVVGDTLSEQYISEDPSGVLWSVDDTVNFAISSKGLLTSITNLAIGEYEVEITAADPYGHSISILVQITVNPEPSDGLPTIILLVIGSGAAVVATVIIVVILKKR